MTFQAGYGGYMGFRDEGLGFPKIRGSIFRGPSNKDNRILGVYIGVRPFWELAGIVNVT